MCNSCTTNSRCVINRIQKLIHYIINGHWLHSVMSVYLCNPSSSHVVYSTQIVTMLLFIPVVSSAFSTICVSYFSFTHMYIGCSVYSKRASFWFLHLCYATIFQLVCLLLPNYISAMMEWLPGVQ